MSNIVYIATSLDGFIADKNNQLDWLFSIPNPEQSDMGFADFMQRIDAVVMGKTTFEVVCGFEGDWSYDKPVFVLSHTLKRIPSKLEGKEVYLVQGDIENVLKSINKQGYHSLYIDGGNVIQQCLKADLIDKMIITSIPILLGEGVPLFGKLTDPLHFVHSKTEHYFDYMVKNTWLRKR